jgi:cytochrome bd-type quinol oxidase subunit 2
MKSNNKNWLVTLFIFLGVLLPLTVSKAATFILDGVTCAEKGGDPVCGLCDFIQVFVNISDMILVASGVVGFLLFIYAGILYLLVPYKPDYVSKAKTMITSVVIGLVIVFGAYTIVSFTLKTIGYGGAWSVCSETPSPAR